MVLVASVVLAGLLQQLEVEPYPASVGEPVTVTAADEGTAIAGLELRVEVPDGTVRAIGATDGQGRLVFVPEAVGQYVFLARLRGVDVLTPLRVVAGGRHWWLAFGSVPLGLAVLWRLSRARDRRAP